FIVLGVFGVALLLSPIGVKIISSLGIADYKVNRFIVAADPFSDKLGTGYQLVNGLISFASGGLFGLGFGTSIRKYTNFPAANTDFILAIIVEELGIVGFMIIFICYILIIYRLFYWALKMKNQKGKVILIGTAMYIFIHFVFNVGGGTALIPLTGVPLLMISQGGSSTMSIMMCIGLSLSVIQMYKSGVIV
ncbi:MAG: FtsW/RodA/SpoVE family cell cycle protein, partial [Erysipelotrichaceae bacterium]|nr:FtsW/RodA/SpoVE family cell cycle protein [Erysipelotrichaceae bacterium]